MNIPRPPGTKIAPWTKNEPPPALPSPFFCLAWVSFFSGGTGAQGYLSKIDEVGLAKGEATGLRGTIALFRWCCAVCQIVLEKKLTLLGGAIKLV